MLRTGHFAAVIMLSAITLSGCASGEPTPQGDTLKTSAPVTNAPTVHTSSTQFGITFPKEGAIMDQDIITVRGTGAQPNTTVEIDVFTNDWYPQSGTPQVSGNDWSYGPCYLKGQGPYKLHHNIRARLMKDGQQIGLAMISDIAVR